MDGAAGNRAEGRFAVLLGARLAEVEALYATALTARSEAEERTRLAELARAAKGLAILAESAAGDHVRTIKYHRPRRISVDRSRLQRRLAHAERTADWIITRSRGESHPSY